MTMGLDVTTTASFRETLVLFLLFLVLLVFFVVSIAFTLKPSCGAVRAMRET
jgi:hypothetical protein